MKTYRDSAVVLRTYNLGEADRIVILFGQKSGQIRAVAKGVRKPSSRFGARLSPFNLVDLQLHRGRTLDTITQVNLLSAYGAPIGADYPSFTAAKVMVEVTQKLTDGAPDPEPELFTLLHGALGAVASRREPPELLAASYLLRTLGLSGWPLEVSACAVCGSGKLAAAFLPEAGGFICRDCLAPGALRVDARMPDLSRALLAGDWETARTADSGLRAEGLTVASKWAEWHLEQRLRTVEHLRAET